jgi:hypothetical protein
VVIGTVTLIGARGQAGWPDDLRSLPTPWQGHDCVEGAR